MPPKIFVVGVADVQGLGSESIRLDFNTGARDFVDETRLANVRESYQDKNRFKRDKTKGALITI